MAAAADSPTTPFLSDNEHDNEHGGMASSQTYRDDPEQPGDMGLPFPMRSLRQDNGAITRCVRATRILGGLVTMITLAVFGLSVFLRVLADHSNLQQTWELTEASEAMAVVAMITALLHIVQPFFTSSCLNLIFAAANFAMTIVLFVFGTRLLNGGWLGPEACRQWVIDPPDESTGYPNYSGHWGKPELGCLNSLRGLHRKVMATAIMSYVAAVLLLILLILRLKLVAKHGLPSSKIAKSWVNSASGRMREWNPTGYTISISLTVRPVGRQEQQQYQQLDTASSPAPVVAGPSTTQETGK